MKSKKNKKFFKSVKPSNHNRDQYINFNIGDVVMTPSGKGEIVGARLLNESFYYSKLYCVKLDKETPFAYYTCKVWKLKS